MKVITRAVTVVMPDNHTNGQPTDPTEVFTEVVQLDDFGESKVMGLSVYVGPPTVTKIEYPDGPAYTADCVPGSDALFEANQAWAKWTRRAEREAKSWPPLNS